MFGSFNTHRGWRGRASSKAKMEVECEAIKLLPSYHIPHFFSVILSDAGSATPISRLLIFKMSQIRGACRFPPPAFSNHPSSNIPP